MMQLYNETMKKILLAGLWVTFSEFLRNELLFKFYWVDHFDSLGLRFETLPLNGVLWMVWSFLLVYVSREFLSVFKFWKGLFLVWIMGFLMMWITIYNLQVLPVALLFFALPWSFVELYVAGTILLKK